MSAILACLPVDRELLTRLIPDLEVPEVYEHSEQAYCEQCGLEIWVGPRLGLAKQLDPDALLVCLICAAKIAGMAGLTGDQVEHLGNTPPRKD